MKRKLLTIAVVLLISSLAPVTAVMLFCTEVPCCFGDAHSGQSLTRAGSDCCTPVSCYESPAQKLPNDASFNAQAVADPLSHIENSPALSLPQAFVQAETASPPPQSIGRRLSALSTLLI